MASFGKRKRTHENEVNNDLQPSLPTNSFNHLLASSSLERCCRPAPFSDDPNAERERESCDYSIRITMEMAKSGDAPRKIRVYADGIYDLFHQGHARQLMQAKSAFPNIYLIVGVSSDAMTHANKGKTVMTDSERYEAVAHCRYVDEVVRDCPWVIDNDFLEKHKIDFVAHDDLPYTLGGHDDVYKEIKAKGMFLVTQRTEGVSTSDLVARIVRDYDLYVRRNLARGYSAKEMNISFLNEKKFLFQNKMDALRDKGKMLVENIEGKRHGLIQKWEEKSRDFISSFLDLFGRDGTLNNLWRESSGRLRRALSPPASPRDHSASPSPSPPPSKIFRYEADDDDWSEGNNERFMYMDEVAEPTE